MRRLLPALALVVSLTPGVATAPAWAQTGPCATPAHRAFDFWVGRWEVTQPNGTVAGRNTIRSRMGGCVLHEHYLTPRGYEGDSFNLFDAARGVWHQSWVDVGGTLLQLDGGLEGDAMVLSGETVDAQGNATLQRITWNQVDGDPDRVRQHWEASTDGGATWTTAFDGLYTRTGDAAAADAPWDLLIRGGTVVDGTGAPAYRADVAVVDERIALVSRAPLDPSKAGRVVDATGMVVSPGFVDLHTHLDPLLRLPGAESHVRQGVTTALGGPDGGGPWPFAAHLTAARRGGVGLNVAFLAGHNTIREEVMGLEDRTPTAEELSRMEGMVAQAMEEGAWGLSTGLKYLPGAFSDVDEVVALSAVAARYGGIYTSHLREEGLGLLDGVGEAMEIGRRAGIPVVLTHHKVVGQPMWGSSARTLAMVDSARAAGTDVMIDQYPYTASYTGITVLVPEWAMAGGTEAFLERMDDAALADSILRGIEFNIVNDRGGNDLSRVQLALVAWDRSLEGRTLKDWAEREGMDPTPANGAKLVVEAVRNGGASAIYHAMDESDVTAILRHPMTMVASDGRLTQPGEGHPHPRWYGTFPRVLGRYVREQGVLTLEEAIHKMTGLPARRMGLPERGEVREGWYADLVVFDPSTVADAATFEEPHQYAVGIPYVVVNGWITVDDGKYRDLRAGRVLTRPVR